MLELEAALTQAADNIERTLLRLGVTLDESQGGEREYMTINQMLGCTVSLSCTGRIKATSGVLESC